jgi:hypothetical protein
MGWIFFSLKCAWANISIKGNWQPVRNTEKQRKQQRTTTCTDQHNYLMKREEKKD